MNTLLALVFEGCLRCHTFKGLQSSLWRPPIPQANVFVLCSEAAYFRSWEKQETRALRPEIRANSKNLRDSAA